MVTGGFTLNNTYYLMRHGESEANASGIIISDPGAGVEGCGLTEKGRAETRESAAKFREQHGLDIVYSSDFRRALETARIAADVCGVGRVHTTELLRERYFGGLEGSDNGNYGMIWALDAADPDNRAHGVESPRDVGDRVINLLCRCEEEHAGESILLVAHGDVLQILYCAANDIPVRRHRSIEPISKAEIRALTGSSTIRQEKYL
jgi:probable phosphoglycerate mutase